MTPDHSTSVRKPREAKECLGDINDLLGALAVVHCSSVVSEVSVALLTVGLYIFS